MQVQRKLTNRVGVQEGHGIEQLFHTLNGRKTELSQGVLHGFAAPARLGVHGLEKARGTALGTNAVVKVGKTALQSGGGKRES